MFLLNSFELWRSWPLLGRHGAQEHQGHLSSCIVIRSLMVAPLPPPLPLNQNKMRYNENKCCYIVGFVFSLFSGNCLLLVFPFFLLLLVRGCLGKSLGRGYRLSCMIDLPSLQLLPGDFSKYRYLLFCNFWLPPSPFFATALVCPPKGIQVGTC